MKPQPDLAEVATARAAIRDLIREAHEMLKDLRAAIREARELQAGTPAHVNEVIDYGLQELKASIERVTNELIGHIEAQCRIVTDHQAQILGSPDTEALMKGLTDSVTESLIEQQDRWLPGHLRVRRG